MTCDDCRLRHRLEQPGTAYRFPTVKGDRVLVLCDHHWVYRIMLGCEALEPATSPLPRIYPERGVSAPPRRSPRR